tara:strand:- start:133 stop:534 length:402 start_codon:yes stop_codon:yes gene_type:complete
MIEYLSIEIKLYIFQFLDVPKKQMNKLRDNRTLIKSFSDLRLVSKNFYLIENTSRCRFCNGRYHYFQLYFTKCYCCGHIINSKNFIKGFKKILFKNRAKNIGISGVNHKLICQHNLIKNVIEEYQDTNLLQLI